MSVGEELAKWQFAPPWSVSDVLLLASVTVAVSGLSAVRTGSVPCSLAWVGDKLGADIGAVLDRHRFTPGANARSDVSMKRLGVLLELAGQEGLELVKLGDCVGYVRGAIASGGRAGGKVKAVNHGLGSFGEPCGSPFLS